MSCPGPSILHTVCAMQGNPPASTEPVKKAKNKLAGPSAYPSLSFIVWPIAARVRKVCQDVPNGVETRVGMRVTLSANIDRDLVNGSEGTHHCVLSSPHHCVPSSPLRALLNAVCSAHCCVLSALVCALLIVVCSSHCCVLFSLLRATGTITGYQPRDRLEDQNLGRSMLTAPHPLIKWDDLPAPTAFKEVGSLLVHCSV